MIDTIYASPGLTTKIMESNLERIGDISSYKNEYILESCVWEITTSCCFDCRHCGSSAGKAQVNELTTEECIDVAKQLSSLGCKRASLIGGEVFMRDDWAYITEVLTTLGLRVSIITNGFLMTPQIIRNIKAAGVESIAVSIDGDKEAHDSFRQNGSFERAINTIDTLIKESIPVAVITTINGENIECLEEIYSVLKNFDIYAWQLQACNPMGNANEEGVDCHFDFNEVIRFVERHMSESKFIIGIADNIGYFTESEGKLRGNLSGYATFRGCSAGIRTIGIDSVGNVRGCESMYDNCFNEGNLRYTSLKEIWESPYAFKYNRQFSTNMLTGRCAECNEGNRCRAGCRSYNFFSHGNLFESQSCVREKGQVR